MERKALLKKLSGDSLIYGISSVLVRFIGFILFPLFARKFNPEDYGVINIFNTLTFFTNAVIVLGMDAATTRWFYDKEEEAYRSKLFSTWWFTHIGIAIGAAVLLQLIGHLYFLDHFVHHPDSRLLMLVVCANIVLQVLPLIANTYFVLNKRPAPSAVFSVLSALTAALCSLYFVFRLQWGVLGFYLGQTVAFFLYSVFSYALYLRKVIFISLFNGKLLKEMIRYGIHVIPANVSGQLLLFLTALIIQSLVSQKDLGYYQIATTLASVIMLIAWPFNLAFQPMSLSMMHQPYADRFYSFILNIYTLALSGLCLCLALFYPEIIQLLLTNKYADSAFISGLLTFSTFVYSLNTIVTIGMTKVKKIKYFGRVISISNIVTIGLVYVFTRYYNLNGAAFGLLVGQCIVIIGLFYYSQKSYFIHYDTAKVVGVILSALTLFLLYHNLLTAYANPVLMKCLLLAAFGIVSIILFPSLWLRARNFSNYLKISM